MGRRPTRLEWIKLYHDRWLDGTTRDELTPDERSVWVDMMAMAGRANDHGLIIAPLSAWPRLLNISEELRDRAIQKCLLYGKISVDGERVTLLNYDLYQPERWERQHYGITENSVDNVDNVDNVERSTISPREEKRRIDKRREDICTPATDSEAPETPKPTKTPDDPKRPYGEFGRVLLTDGQKAKLDVRFGVSGAEELITAVDAWAQSNGRVKKDWYATCLTWARNESKFSRGGAVAPDPPYVRKALPSAAEVERKRKALEQMAAKAEGPKREEAVKKLGELLGNGGRGMKRIGGG